MNNATPTDSPASPCIRKCCLNDADICVGCWRTLEEIKVWHGASDTEKNNIINNCKQRQLDTKINT